MESRTQDAGGTSWEYVSMLLALYDVVTGAGPERQSREESHRQQLSRTEPQTGAYDPAKRRLIVMQNTCHEGHSYNTCIAKLIKTLPPMDIEISQRLRQCGTELRCLALP
ncbi:unnamed protein product [Pleuronectes platessa]|uniref:Uncharacterized protein n=1 Tax=Pleuronectes platessa TaxID=8262 RepID=A0A9N7W1M1_PLEPL|nr:unnamed protein product [Pleuronectes platessa]